MVVHADIVEDFSRSLSELNDMLSVSVHQKDPIFNGMVKDAQIFSFLRTSEVLRSLIKNIHDENTDEAHRADMETAVVTLCMLDLIDDEKAKNFLEQFDAAEFLALDRSWLDDEGDRCLFDSGMYDITSYCNQMITLLDVVSSQCTLIESEENYERGH